MHSDIKFFKKSSSWCKGEAKTENGVIYFLYQFNGHIENSKTFNPKNSVASVLNLDYQFVVSVIKKIFSFTHTLTFLIGSIYYISSYHLLEFVLNVC